MLAVVILLFSAFCFIVGIAGVIVYFEDRVNKSLFHGLWFIFLAAINVFTGLNCSHEEIDGGIIIPHEIEKTSDATYVTYKEGHDFETIKSEEIKYYAASTSNIVIRKTIYNNIRGKESRVKYKLEIGDE
jgi:hypothetical protein